MGILDGLMGNVPGIIDRMTPHGFIPANQQDLVAQALSMLQQPRSA